MKRNIEMHINIGFYDKKEQLLCKILYNFLSFSFDFQFELCDNENIS